LFFKKIKIFLVSFAIALPDEPGLGFNMLSAFKILEKNIS
jgi:hypothetical protein